MPCIRSQYQLHSKVISDAPELSSKMNTDSVPSRVRFEVFRAAHNDDAQEESPLDPEDLDELFDSFRISSPKQDDESLLNAIGGSEIDLDEDDSFTDDSKERRVFDNPNQRLLDRDASLIPGSPFSKPMNRSSSRPSDAMSIARVTANVSFLATLAAVGFLVYISVTNFESSGRITLSSFLSIISFFGMFWSFYVIVSVFLQCFIPAKAFKTNTKFCSIIPETKAPTALWVDVTIQIPVDHEPLQEVLVPTLKSCVLARAHYTRNTEAQCNIVVCDDGLMTLLRDNFAAAELLWENICRTKGRTIRLSNLLKGLSRPVRKHLKGLRSKAVHEAFLRLLFYYHYKIGFVARSALGRHGKSRTESNLNSHLRLALASMQRQENEGDELSFEDALLEISHHDDGSRHIMFGNNVSLGKLIIVGSPDMLIPEAVIVQTVPEFLNDPTLGFTQHAMKAKPRQRRETYFTRLMGTYYEFLFVGQFLLSAIVGCQPPLLGSAMVVRTEAIAQCGKVRSLRTAQRWLQNIGVEFLPVDQIGFGNLQANRRTEYWSEKHTWGAFEMMFHMYNLGFNGRYCAFPACEFEVGVPRTFDELASSHRSLAKGAHEILFNSFQDMMGGHGIFTRLFREFMACGMQSYYKTYLFAYLCSYTIGGTYILAFYIDAIFRILDENDDENEAVDEFHSFSPASAIILLFAFANIFGNVTLTFVMFRLRKNNIKLLGQQKKQFGGYCCFALSTIRYCVLQMLIQPISFIMFSFLGATDHLVSKQFSGSLPYRYQRIRYRCSSVMQLVRCNIGSWYLAVVLAGLAYATVLRKTDWDPFVLPDDLATHVLFAGPALYLAAVTLFVPIILNPYVIGCPFFCQSNGITGPRQPAHSRPAEGIEVKVEDLGSFLAASKALDAEMRHLDSKPDIELASHDLQTRAPRNEGRRYDQTQFKGDAKAPVHSTRTAPHRLQKHGNRGTAATVPNRR